MFVGVDVDADVIKRGFKFADAFGEFRVMAVADGYAMIRRPGCQPTVKSVREIILILDGQEKQKTKGKTDGPI